jgi:hypothetical protein
MEFLLTIGLFLALNCSFYLLGRSGISRKRYRLLTSTLLAGTFFTLALLFVKNDTIIIGSILFVLTFIGGYLWFPLLIRRKSIKMTKIVYRFVCNH